MRDKPDLFVQELTCVKKATTSGVRTALSESIRVIPTALFGALASFLGDQTFHAR